MDEVVKRIFAHLLYLANRGLGPQMKKRSETQMMGTFAFTSREEQAGYF